MTAPQIPHRRLSLIESLGDQPASQTIDGEQRDALHRPVIPAKTSLAALGHA